LLSLSKEALSADVLLPNLVALITVEMLTPKGRQQEVALNVAAMEVLKMMIQDA